MRVPALPEGQRRTGFTRSISRLRLRVFPHGNCGIDVSRWSPRFSGKRDCPRLWAPVRQDLPGRGASLSRDRCGVCSRWRTRLLSSSVASQHADQPRTSPGGAWSLAATRSRARSHVGGKSRRFRNRAAMPVGGVNPIWRVGQEADHLAFQRRIARCSRSCLNYGVSGQNRLVDGDRPTGHNRITP